MTVSDEIRTQTMHKRVNTAATNASLTTGASSFAIGRRRQTQSQTRIQASKDYYFKNIHNQNKAQILKSQTNRHKNFVPFDTKEKTFEQRFQTYFTELTKDDKPRVVKPAWREPEVQIKAAL